MRSTNSAITSAGIPRVSSTIWSSVIGTRQTLPRKYDFDKRFNSSGACRMSGRPPLPDPLLRRRRGRRYIGHVPQVAPRRLGATWGYFPRLLQSRQLAALRADTQKIGRNGVSRGLRKQGGDRRRRRMPAGLGRFRRLDRGWNALLRGRPRRRGGFRSLRCS